MFRDVPGIGDSRAITSSHKTVTWSSFICYASLVFNCQGIFSVYVSQAQVLLVSGIHSCPHQWHEKNDMFLRKMMLLNHISKESVFEDFIPFCVTQMPAILWLMIFCDSEAFLGVSHNHLSSRGKSPNIYLFYLITFNWQKLHVFVT
jgi:hypothetical protein